MSWINGGYAKRAAIAIDNTGAAASPKDVTVAIPREWDFFWGSVLSTGFDLRFTKADGAVILDHKRTTWTYASRAATLEIDACPVVTGMCVAWMYWGLSSASDGATTPTISSALTGTIHVGAAAPLRTLALPERPGATTPRTSFAKLSGEATWLWFDFEPRLHTAAGGVNGAAAWEELAAVTAVHVYDAAGVDQTAMYDKTLTRFVDAAVGVWVLGGTTGTDYTVVVRVTTTQGRTLEARARLRVRDVGV